MKLFLKIFAFLSLTALAIAQPTPTFSVTANSSGTIIAPSNVKVGLTSQVNGILPIANGGTGTTAPGESAGTGIAVSGSFPNKTISNTGVTNLVAGTGVTLNTNNGSVTINATGTGGTVTSVGSTGTVQGISLTGTVTTSGSLTLGGSLSPINLGTQVTGTLNVASGGTGVTSSSGANSVVLRDSNSNASVNNLFEGFSTITASGTTVTLTIASVQNFVVNGSGGQIIKLPDATTLSNGTDFIFNNNQSSGTVTVQNNSATTVCTLQSGSYIVVTLLSNSTAAGTWDYHNVAPSNASWSTNTLNWAGSYTNGTWNGNAVGALYGGTGTTGLTGYVYGNGTSAMTASTTIPTTALSGTITNAQLTNNSITVTAGSGLSGGGSVALGGTTTLTNAGVTNIVAGTGITVNAATGSVTINSTATGSVTSVSVTGNSGVLAGVATATTTPAISIGLGNITPTSITSSGTLNISNTTTSTSTTTGAIIDAGGLGVGGNGYFGGYVYLGGPLLANSYISLPNNVPLYWNDGGGTARRAGLWNLYNNIYFGDIDNSNNSNLVLMSGGTGGTHFYNNGFENVTITSAGNVGIGTSSPAQKVEVDASANSQQCISLRNLNSGSGSSMGLLLGNDANSAFGSIFCGSTSYSSFGGASSINLGTYSTNPLVFFTNNAERARIDSSGNLGLGVTPSAWGSTRTAIQIGLGGAIQGDKNGYTFLDTSANMVFNGTSENYLSSNLATKYRQIVGQHQWYTAPSGTAGNAITFTQAMTLDASGQLLLGTTTPVATGAGSLTVGATTASTSTTSGALTVAGGVGIAGNLNTGTSDASAPVVYNSSNLSHNMLGKIFVYTVGTGTAQTLATFTPDVNYCTIMIKVLIRGSQAGSSNAWEDVGYASYCRSGGSYVSSTATVTNVVNISGTHTLGTLSWLNVSGSNPVLQYKQGSNGYPTEILDVYISGRDGFGCTFSTAVVSQ